MKLQIIREKWARATIGGPSALVNGFGNMCCLGFLGEACGYGSAEMRNKTSPMRIDGIDSVNSKWPAGTLCARRNDYDPLYVNTSIIRDLIRVNDDMEITDTYREGCIISFMKQLDVEVEFV